MTNYRIGLEIHVQLTEAGTKLFCDCKSDYRGLPPNSNVCPVCLGLPGALPVPKRRPLVLAAAAALMMGCEIPEYMIFTRKHYFYPDLPKNYQITQYQGGGGAPICLRGRLRYYDPDRVVWREVGIRRINIEEDPARTEYEGSILSSEYAYVDYNRSGVPLVEVVTEPEVRSPRDARRLVEYLLLSLEYIGATNPRLEGSFRVDANVSVGPGERVEVKNIGSTLDLERALSYEIFRQDKILSQRGTVRRETRSWDPVRRVTKPLRTKETEEEYLYFPDPDIPPVPTRDLLKEARPLTLLLPDKVMERVQRYGVDKGMAWALVAVRPALSVFLASVSMGAEPSIAARLLAIDLRGLLRKQGKDVFSKASWPPPSSIKAISDLVTSRRYTYDEVKYNLLPRLASEPELNPLTLLPPKAYDLLDTVKSIVEAERKAVIDYINGKAEALDYLVGEVLKARKGEAVDPKMVRVLLEKVISEIGLPANH
ncbi:MAG: Asp-tRNA(Asn)/Glu-tRNA(Gln) amidotransferase subunit GatB [Acidilobus sp.]